MLKGQIAKKVGGYIFPEKELQSIVHNYATVASIVMALPLFGIDWLVYIIVLWCMYSSLAEKSGKSLNAGTIIVGILVNILVALFMIGLDAVLSFIPVVGWIVEAFAVWIQFYLSGRGFIDTLRDL